ncbi:hypothetical protein R50073_20760 [Maricurvus nonylphenolicus]
MQINSQLVDTIPRVLRENAVNQAHVAKVIASENGPLLQITEAAGKPRRYFDLKTQHELTDYDQQQARWLASYYTGRPQSEIDAVTMQTEFNHQYPWVNRLLPVYRIEFAGSEQLTAYIHTETNALASLSNQTKRVLQGLFQALHSWDWLSASTDSTKAGVEWIRVILIALFMCCLATMAITGLSLLALLKQRRMPQATRYWHRILGYALWLPILGWSASGFYHLLQSAYIAPGDERVIGIQLPPVMDLRSLELANASSDPSTTLEQFALSNTPLNAVNVIAADNQIYYRLSKAVTDKTVPSRQQVYQGRPKESGAIYLDSATGNKATLTDQQMAQFMAVGLTGLNTEDIVQVLQIKRFGPGYDFRNKRLPVWQVDFANDEQHRIFVDPASGVLVDQNRAIDRYESWSFSLLHKWNHLTPLMGRFKRDILIVATLLVIGIFTVFGVMQLRRRSRPVNRQPSPQTVNQWNPQTDQGE